MDDKNIFTGTNIRDLLKSQPDIFQPKLVDPYNYKAVNEAVEQMHRQKAEDRQVQKNIEAHTKKTAENTEWLSQSVNLIRINNERQTELLEMITNVLALANETDKVEAESKLRIILNNVQGFKENYELATFLKDIGEGIIQLISNS